jgi:acetyltransferase-like isoleucine patch superfamily enzyme
MSQVLARPPTGPSNDAIEGRPAEPEAHRVGALSRFLEEARYVFSILEPRRALWAATGLLPDFTLPGTRAQALRIAGCDVRRRVSVFGHVRLVGPRGSAKNLRIGPGSFISTNVTFCLDAPITLGKNVSIGPHAMLYTATHALGLAERRMHMTSIAEPIVVEDGVWVGLAALILPGVRLGAGCVVSAGAVVTKDVPPHRIVAGNPAAVISHLPED